MTSSRTARARTEPEEDRYTRFQDAASTPDRNNYKGSSAEEIYGKFKYPVQTRPSHQCQYQVCSGAGIFEPPFKGNSHGQVQGFQGEERISQSETAGENITAGCIYNYYIPRQPEETTASTTAGTGGCHSTLAFPWLRSLAGLLELRHRVGRLPPMQLRGVRHAQLTALYSSPFLWLPWSVLHFSGFPWFYSYL